MITAKKTPVPRITQTVLLSGLLKRPGVIATCLVKAERTIKPQPEEWEYVKADVANAPHLLPDGDYELQFESRKVKVKKQGKRWISRSILVS